MKGFINLYKPAGMSSAGAVSAVKRKFHIACGHMGTLDPMASGVLPVGLEKTCRLFPYLLDKVKVYKAKFLFGIDTDTLDTTGEIIGRSEVIPSESQIIKVLDRFTGEINQIPPKYSSKCINGKRGYQLARKGVEFELAPKKVMIYDIKCTGKTGVNEYEFTVKCGGGTYIRSLARDIGKELNTYAVMSALERVESGKFKADNAVSIEEFINSETPEKYIIPADFAVDYPSLVLTNERATKILNGVFNNYGYKDGIYRVYNEDEFWGIGQVKGGVLRIDAYVR